MSNGDRRIEGLLDQHREYVESIGNSITEGAWEGIREGISSGAKKGVKEGLKKCLAAGFPNVHTDTIEDIAGTISGLAISNNINKGTSEAIETSLKGYLDRLSDEIVNGIRRQELPLGVDQLADVVELIKNRQQRIAHLITERLPHNPLSGAVIAGVQTAFDEGLDRSIRGFMARIRRLIAAERDSEHEVVEKPTEQRWAQQIDDLKSSVRRTAAAATEEAVASLIEHLTRRAIATLRKRLKDESLRDLEKAVRHTAEQKLDNGLDESIRLLSEEMVKESSDTMSFVTDLDGSFGNNLSDYLLSLPQGPRFPLWKGLLVAGCVLAAAITGTVYALPSGDEEPEAIASIDWVDGSTIGFSSDGSSAPDGFIESYYWDFGDGNASEEPNPVHTYEDGGDYAVVLTVSDDEGKTGENAVHVAVAPPPALPDLVITEVGFGIEGPFFIIGYQIKNQGEVQADPSFIYMMAGDEEWCFDRIDALAAGEFWEGEFDDPGCFLSEREMPVLWLKTDATDLVRESDETNNTATPEFP